MNFFFNEVAVVASSTDTNKLEKSCYFYTLHLNLQFEFLEKELRNIMKL